MADLGSLVVKIETDLRELNKGLKTADKQIKGFSASTERHLKTIGKTMTVIGATITAASVSIIKLALDAEESENLFVESMGEMADAARDWSKELSRTLGLNQFDIRKTVGTMNVMIKSMGLSTEQAYDMSTSLVELSQDMASFFNLKPEDAFRKIQAGITGETEPLKRLGILVNENTIKQYAYNRGLVEHGEVLTEQEKVLARYYAILDQTQAAQGDLARTVDSGTNRLRIMQSRLKELGITLGIFLLPVLNDVIANISDLIKQMQSFVEINPRLASIITRLISFLGALFVVLGPILIILPKIVAFFASLNPIVAGTIVAVGGLTAAMVTFRDETKVVLNEITATWQLAYLKATRFITNMKLLFGLDPFAEARKGLDFSEGSTATAEVTISKSFGGDDEQESKAERTKSIFEELNRIFFETEENKRLALEETQSLYEAMLQGRVAMTGSYAQEETAQWGIQNQERINFLQEYNNLVTAKYKGWLTLFTSMTKQLASGIRSAITGIITGTKTAGEAFKQLGAQMISTVVDFVVQKGIAWATEKILATTAAATQSALAFATGSAVASAWAPAAALVSLATFGANAAPASAALSTVTGLAHALSVPKFADGGYVDKPTLALVGEAGGEFIVPEKQFTGGGGVNVTVHAVIDNDLDIDILAERLGERIEEQRGVI